MIVKKRPVSVTPDGTQGGNYQVGIRSDVPSQVVRVGGGGGEATIVLLIVPTGDPDNSLRLGPIVALFPACKEEAAFSSVFFFVK